MTTVDHSTKRPRWFRYSLRTAAVVLTLMCLWFGFVAAQIHRQRRAVDAITEAGGSVQFDYQFQSRRGPWSPDPKAAVPGPVWLRRVVGDDFFRSPRGAVLSGPHVTDDLIENHLSKLTTLTMLRIESPQVSDQALPHIAKLKNLELLQLHAPKITAVGLLHLEPLRSLKLIQSFKDVGNQAVMQRLDAQTAVEFVETPVQDVMDFFSDLHKVRFEFDPSISFGRRQSPVTATIKGISLRDALHELLDDKELGFVVRSGAIVITSRQDALEAAMGRTTLKKLFPNAQVESDW